VRHREIGNDQQELAALYALGALAPAEREHFERHLVADECELCRREVETMRQVCGDLALAPSPAPPSPAVRARVLAAAGRRPAPFPTDLFVRLADEGEWVERKPGVYAKELIPPRPGDRSRSYLVRMDPGTVLDRHEHDGFEHCYVVSGSTVVGGRRMRAGDYSYAPRGTVHGAIPSDQGALLFIVQTF